MVGHDREQGSEEEANEGDGERVSDLRVNEPDNKFEPTNGLRKFMSGQINGAKSERVRA